MQVLDIHSHFFPKQWEDLQARFGGDDWPWLKHNGDGTAMVMKGNSPFRPIYQACWDPDTRLAEMDRDGLCGQILSATPVLFGYDRPAAQAEYLAKLFNDAAMEICAQGKGRLFAMAQVPLQDIDAACAEASRAKAIGHVGVQIGSHVNGRGMDDTATLTFLQHCADEEIPVFVHPWDMIGADRTANYMMGWTVGMPAETQLSIVSLILGGGFDRLSPKLKIAFAHGGGSFVFLLGRLDNAWHHRDIARGRSEHPPSHYLDRFYLDSAVFDDGALRLLVDKMGDQRVMFGTDYPFPLGEQTMGALIRNTEGLGEQSKRRLFVDNAREFFNLR
ncbi:amidohydrolase family protein [Ferrimonas balearica]|uniref:amidohydrolase family protein n=1 Tax=Ferrimonas balearica TaxID=44012 RepID=UPI001C990548|nr:amidohydrolase family protein [Ferrimonas balearica]MBY5990891.1 amidohydrolase [Ferrimonas balearica]